MAVVTIEKLSKVYPNGTKAVSDLDITVADGEFMVLVGPSGCGKTTALRMVAGLEEISSGVVRFGDWVVNGVPPRERDVAMVFQNYALYPHMSVAENIGFSLTQRKVPKDEARRRVEEAARILGLSEVLSRKPGQLSGGQRQRVAMGRAIVREPAVFLMDEPLSNLDAKLRVQMRAEVSRVQRQVAVATLYVTHDQTEAMTMGDRVAVLRAGALQQCDDPQVLYDRPDNLFVAAFIGSPAMNLYEGALVGEGDEMAVVLGGQRLALGPATMVARPGLARYRGRPVVVGIRPEHLSTGGQGGPRAAGGPTLAAEVTLVEALGSELLVHFQLTAKRVQLDIEPAAEETPGEAGSAPARARADGMARVPPRTPVKSGDVVTFDVDTDELHFFDPATEAAIVG